MNISTIITGINNTLNICDKIIPLYKDIKPFINSSKNIISSLNKDDIKETKKEVNNNLPTFFQ